MTILNTTNNAPTVSFAEYAELMESINAPAPDVKQDAILSSMISSGYRNLSDVSVHYTDAMDEHGLRILSFKNPQNRYELHVHNNYVLPGSKPDDVNHAAMLSGLKVMYQLAKKHLDNGYPVQIQVGPDGANYSKYHSIAKRLVAQTGHSVRELDKQPLSSMPHLMSKAFLIEHVQT